MGDSGRMEYHERISRLGLILAPVGCLKSWANQRVRIIREYALGNANEWLYFSITGTVEA